MASVIIKASEFKYPNKAELKQVKLETPKFHSFDFPPVDEFDEIFNKRRDIKEVARRNQLHWWNQCLINRRGRLLQTYRQVLTHYKRGVPDEFKDYERNHFINRAQFGYYSETYFYFFFTVRDTIAQLINIYFSMKIEENRLFVNEGFCNRIPDNQVKDLFKAFMNDIAITVDYRNALTHRFLVTLPDFRPTLDDANMTYSAGTGSHIRPSELYSEIKRSLYSMSEFMDSLNFRLKQLSKVK